VSEHVSNAEVWRATIRKLRKVEAERDEAHLRWQRLYGEIDCRIEHGADSNGHLEAIRKMMQKIEK
jgi:hypothetical protein